MNKDIYKEYCPHGNPIYYSACPGCSLDKQRKDNIIYNTYLKKISFNFKKYINQQYDYFFINPSIDSDKEVYLRKNDKFIRLKKSNSQEELKHEYYRLARLYHPDKPTGGTKIFQKLSQIYNLMMEQFIT